MSAFTATHHLSVAGNFEIHDPHPSENGAYLQAYFIPITREAKGLFHDIFVEFDPATGEIRDIEGESPIGDFYTVNLTLDDQQFIRAQFYSTLLGG